MGAKEDSIGAPGSFCLFSAKRPKDVGVLTEKRVETRESYTHLYPIFELMSTFAPLVQTCCVGRDWLAATVPGLARVTVGRFRSIF